MIPVLEHFTLPSSILKFGALIALGLLALTSAPVRADTFNVMDFGATGNGTTNDQPAIQAAIKAAIAAGPGNNISLPTGTFLLTTHNKSGCIFDIDSSHHLTFVGAGTDKTKLISAVKSTQLLEMDNNTDVLLKDFSVDYQPYAYSQGTITAFSPGAKSVTFTTDPGFDQPDRADLLPAGNKSLYLWSNPKRVSYDTYYGAEPAVTNYTQTSPGVWQFRLSYLPGTRLFVGEKAVIWTRWANNAIVFNNNHNVTISHVSLYDEGWNQAFYAAGNTGAITMTAFNITTPPGSGRLLSAASGSQCGNRASFTMDGCNVISHLDDAVNTLAEWRPVLAQVAPNQLKVNHGDYQIGDTLEVWNWPAGGWPQISLLACAHISAVGPTSDHAGDLLTLDTNVALPNGVGAYKVIDNNQAGPVVVENGSFSCSRARPLLLKSGTSILVQNNLIYDSASPLQLGAEPGWTEGPRPINITVRNNTFRDMDTIALSVGVGGAITNNLATGVLITGNLFQDGGQETICTNSDAPYGTALQVCNAVAPVIEHNSFSNNWNTNISLSNDTNVVVSNNIFDSPNAVHPPKVTGRFYDTVVWADRVQGLTLSGNKLTNPGSHNTSFLYLTDTVTGLEDSGNGDLAVSSPSSRQSQ